MWDQMHNLWRAVRYIFRRYTERTANPISRAASTLAHTVKLSPHVACLLARVDDSTATVPRAVTQYAARGSCAALQIKMYLGSRYCHEIIIELFNFILNLCTTRKSGPFARLARTETETSSDE